MFKSEMKATIIVSICVIMLLFVSSPCFGDDLDITISSDDFVVLWVDPEPVEAEWPDGYPEWWILDNEDNFYEDVEWEGMTTYLFIPSGAGLYGVCGYCGSDYEIFVIAAVEIKSLTRAEVYVPRKPLGTSPMAVLASDSQNIITVETNPQGFEGQVALAVSTGDGTISRDTSDPTKFIYQAPTELQSNVGVPMSTGIKISSSLFGELTSKEITFSLESVFQHYGYKSTSISNRGKALLYAKWKYSISTTGCSSLGYDPTQSSSGYCNQTNDVTLGPGAFSGEWMCASVLGHETVHANQSWWYKTTNPIACERPACEWELDHSNAPGCTLTPLTYLYTYQRTEYDGCKIYYASKGGTGTYP